MAQYATTQTVLKELDLFIAEGVTRRTRSVCNTLSIFDWWRDTLSVSAMKQMRTFLRTATKLCYDGYVCFKVGAAGCASGMWAYREESENGYSPEGEFIYRSFQGSDNYWDIIFEDGSRLSDDTDGFDSIKTARQLMELKTKHDWAQAR